jgi:hypothetical protein
MRLLSVLLLLFFSTALKAQYLTPFDYMGYAPRPMYLNNIHLNDSVSNKKWSVSKYTGISTSFSFFNGGNATIVSAPIGLQLNRRLNDNLYAFAVVSVAPAYVNFNQRFLAAPINKGMQNGFYNSNGFGMYSAASMGLMYVNDARTFSISGSVSIERSSYPVMSYSNQATPVKLGPALPVNDDKRLH